MTNYEWLGSISLEQMVDFLQIGLTCDNCAYVNTDSCEAWNCKHGIKEWLKSEHMTYKDTLERALSAWNTNAYVGSYFNSCDLNNICAALRKQIPKKPLGKKDLADLVIAYCPTCGDGVNSEYPCCSHCGQRINWGDDGE